MGALLGFHVGIWGYATSYTTHACVAHATVVEQVQKNNDFCGWMGVQVSPMTAEPLLDHLVGASDQHRRHKELAMVACQVKKKPRRMGLSSVKEVPVIGRGQGC